MSESKSSELGLCDAFLVLFVALKLTGHIAWSWWWVLSPGWGPLLFWLVVSVPVALWRDGRVRKREQTAADALRERLENASPHVPERPFAGRERPRA